MALNDPDNRKRGTDNTLFRPDQPGRGRKLPGTGEN